MQERLPLREVQYLNMEGQQAQSLKRSDARTRVPTSSVVATLQNVALTIEFPLRVVLYPAPDVDGQWIAHGLETDIVT